MLPSGTVTFLFTDIEGSTKLVQQYPDSGASLLARHHTILQNAVEAHDGYVFQVIGDAFCVAFQTVRQALDAALDIQHALATEAWAPAPIKVRMGIHTGAAQLKTESDEPSGYSGYLSLARVQHVMSVAYGGQILLSNASAELVRTNLPPNASLRDLGPNRLKGMLNPEHLWQVLAPGLQRDFPPLISLAAIPNNLPLQLTSFVGRERELGEVRQLLGKHRLVTLTGSGGTGKSRLSLQVAAQASEDFIHGTWLIELASLSDAVLVPNAVASVLGLRQEPDRPLMHTILDWLRTREVLIILDNCEHLLDACVHFADSALRVSPDIRILATSRQPLGLAGEACFRVPSLRCPTTDQASRLRADQLQEYPAAQLFIERASESLTTFAVSDADVTSIAEICHRLDGIPLAIELAAARVKALRVEQIVARLDDRFRLLTGGSRTALPRHQTLLALIEWSHNMLSGPERVLLRRLSIFAGGWTLDAAEAVCAGEGLESAEVLDLLIQLVDKSLIGLDDRSAQPRYRMLETIREYARTRLAEAGERELLGQRHLHFFLDMAEQTRPLLHTEARLGTLLRLEAEHDNLRAALEWACAHDIEIGRWLGGILERFWFFGDHLGEAYTWYGRLLEGSEKIAASRGLALAALGAGCVAFNLELMDEAQRSLETSVKLWQQLADQQWSAYSLEWLAYLLLQRGEAATAEEIYSRNEASFRAQSDHLNMVWVLSCWGTAKSLLSRDDPSGKALLDDALALARLDEDPFCFMMCYSCLGDWAVLHDDYATARDHFLEALRWRRKLGTRWILAAGLWQVASILSLQGDYSGARPMYQEALQLAGDLGDQRSQAHISQELGVVATHLGQVTQASILLESSLTMFHRWADPLGIARCILGFADLRHAQGDAEVAARLLGFLEAWLRANTIQLLHFDLANYERSHTAARAQLSELTFTLSQAAGSKLTLEQAVALALRPLRLGGNHP